MKINLKQYKHVKTEVDSLEFEIPIEPQYFFETGIRRSIRIVPKWTDWNVREYDKPEVVHEIVFTCVYGSFECKIEQFSLYPNSLEEQYFGNTIYSGLIKSWIDGALNKRTKEQFEADLESQISNINNP